MQDESDPGSDSFSGSGIGSTELEPPGASERALLDRNDAISGGGRDRRPVV